MSPLFGVTSIVIIGKVIISIVVVFKIIYAFFDTFHLRIFAFLTPYAKILRPLNHWFFFDSSWLELTIHLFYFPFTLASGMSEIGFSTYPFPLK
jgi:hypothetical protein